MVHGENPPPPEWAVLNRFFYKVIVTQKQPQSLQAGSWEVFGPRVEKKCYIVKLPKNTKYIRIINDTSFKGF